MKEKHEKIIYLLKQLWNNIGNKRKVEFKILTFFVFVSSFAEIISLGAVIPFLSVLLTPERVMNSTIIKQINEINPFFEIKTKEDTIIIITYIFATAAIISGCLRVVLLKLITKFSFATANEIGIKVFQKTLYQPYDEQIKNNSNKIVNNITNNVDGVVYGVILPLIFMKSSILVSLTICIGALFLNTYITIASLIILCMAYIFINITSKNKIQNNSKLITDGQKQVIKTVQEGLGAIRDVIIDGTHEVFIKLYTKADLPVRIAQGKNSFISLYPRHLIETVGIITIIFMAYFLSKTEEGLINYIPMIGAFALIAQRLLPALQQIHYSWTNISGNYHCLSEIVISLNKNETNMKSEVNKKINFDRTIKLKNVNYGYENNNLIIQNCNIEINKGSKVGIIGKTGSGKSTIVDLLMGLILPSDGSIYIDDIPLSKINVYEWQKNIAHVSQDIFLIDGTIEENIALSDLGKKIDHELVKKAAEQAQISEYINSLNLGYLTLVGERGVRLSGGQKQRIAIARALYKQATVIIFDEATSALDVETEMSVMESIGKLSREVTIILVAHRLSTLDYCDYIIEIKDGNINKKTN